MRTGFWVECTVGCSGPLSVSPVWGCGWGYRPYFENYTVDASIFEMILRDCFVIDDLKDH